MENVLTHNDLPEYVSKIWAEVVSLREIIQKKDNQISLQNVEPDIVSIHGAAEILHLALPTVYSKTSKGEIPFMKKGKRLYFSKMQLLEYLKEGQSKSQSQIRAEVDTNLSKNKKG